ncbi:MAG: hypothetical protein D4R70_02995, partial [Betaproteobacteria bacterium]
KKCAIWLSIKAGISSGFCTPQYIVQSLSTGTVGGVGKPPTYILADLATLAFLTVDVPTEPGEACNVRPASEHA